jgi:hypothetical protein
MKMFVCHASEDKADFVVPLVEALKSEGYDVWFDADKLTLGDSLLTKINEGLASCDFGVVVLSRPFFLKHWPKSELDGLFTLETTTRKLILPILKDINIEELKASYPMLAGRLVAFSSEGVSAIVSKIRVAVEASNRTRELTAMESTLKKAKNVALTLKEKNNAEQLSHSERGVALVRSALGNIVQVFQATIATIAGSENPLDLRSQRPTQVMFRFFQVFGPRKLAMTLDLEGLGGNYTYEAVLCVRIYRDEGMFAEGLPEVFHELEFKPTFRLPEQVVWAGTQNDAFSNEELVSVLMNEFVEQITKRAQDSDRRITGNRTLEDDDDDR